MLIPGFYENLSVLHQNTMPVHSYFIPTSRKIGGITGFQSRQESDRLQMLSGSSWLFRYFPSVLDLEDEFYRRDYCPGDGWAEETVPFCWQMRGYDTPQYTNIRYPFTFDPPYVPQQNPCGAYIRRFFWEPDPEAPKTFLHFEGVDSCFFVWLNGSYVGYSQVTHHTSEFDVTNLLMEGENILAVLVLKWCDGSYLEDQDKFRFSGIIRDVFLIRRPRKHITDYVITTQLSEDLLSAELNIRFCFSEEPIPVRLKLFYDTPAGDEGSTHDRRPANDEGLMQNRNPAADEDLAQNRNSAWARAVCYHLSSCTEATLKVDPVFLWNAETPSLYTLIIETDSEVIRERVGFRQICVRDGKVLLNGAPIKFRGVNRHESDPVTGSVVCRENVLKDLRMIKEHNFNAVRASHYPNVPYFYQFCDELGLYVIDEADNESHGTAPLYFTEDDYAERMKLSHERIADNPDFIRATLDRVSSMVLRNRNRPSILVWSMGNECGYGCTFEEALRWTKQTDPSRLTHYESAYYLPSDREYDVSDIDLFGRMYPAFEEITEYFRTKPDKPLLLVEYCHSMGNSPGDLQEYRDLTEKYDGLCGGFVWEWCDHAIFKGLSGNGKAMYWYGGDHGELQHDGNFCLDGLVGPDRTPHPGLYEYKNVHRPVRAAFDAVSSTLTLFNHWDFLELSSSASASFCLTVDGDAVQKGTLPLPPVPPHSSASVPLDLRIPTAGRCFLIIRYALKRAAAGLPEGHMLGFDEIPIENADGRNQKARSLFAEKSHKEENLKEACVPSIRKEGSELRISGTDFEYQLDMLTGCFTSLRKGSTEFLTRPVDYNLWRAPTDNDRKAADLWKWERLDHTITRAYELTWQITGSSALIRIRQSVAAVSVQPILRLMTEYCISGDGTIRMDFHAEKDRQIRTLPRIGLRLFLCPALDWVDYYGIGPNESYIDKCRSGWHGNFSAPLHALQEDYIRPQENGSHCGCDLVRLSGEGHSLAVSSGDSSTFSFQASIYTQEELENRRHNYELVPCGDTVLCIDHKMAGIGSNSCGPELSEAYQIDDDEYQFSFLLKLF